MSLSQFSLRAEVPISVIFVHAKYNMVSPTIPARNVLLRENVIVHLPFDCEAAEPLVEVGPATELGRAGFVRVKVVELCALVGVADAPWLESVIPGSNELKLAGGRVDYIAPHQPLHSAPIPN
jgi:hypothetical protein